MKYLKIILLLIILSLVVYFNQDITNYIIENYIYYNESIYLEENNEYKLNYSFKYLENTNNFKVSNKTQLINALYTILNNGTSEFDFYCDYEECKNDIDSISKDETLSFINNFVHPYNSYKKVYLTVNSYNKISVSFEKTYTEYEIMQVENKINEIISSIITDDMTTKEKIIAFHDYIIDNTKYDSAYINANLDDINSPSHKATGVLFYNKALCGGYADIMSIFLNKLNIPNYLISSEYHVWNAVYLDNTWYHLDLTWDDPVTSDGTDIRLDKFLLITDDELSSYNTGYHNYDKNIYLEFSS
jgi:hypothetical protein